MSSTDTALSPRGFNDVSANKLLALVDGRSIYSPLFGGVQYRGHDMVMADIERIAIIRCPGATLWGANAVNVVVNITTKSAHETLGSLVNVGVSDDGVTSGTVRHSFSVDQTTDARVWTQYREHDSFLNSTDPGETPMDSMIAGLRIDRRTKHNGTFTFIADWSESRLSYEETVFDLSPSYVTRVPTVDHSRQGSALARLQRSFGESSSYELQAWTEYAHADRLSLGHRSLVSDLEFTLRHKASERHEFVAGLGTRYHTDEVDSSAQFRFESALSQQSLFTGFVQERDHPGSRPFHHHRRNQY
ncbi:MAG: TonB-dependent receptor plug domain-containing protein [Candidatus Synoicihabitans palmerolidicus]|nr:TonB-dependent receptor plug domain-containing protein [Candidatus Synoicihabitans palmerolidicus]